MGYGEKSWDVPRWLFNAAIKRNAKQLSVGWLSFDFNDFFFDFSFHFKYFNMGCVFMGCDVRRLTRKFLALDILK